MMPAGTTVKSLIFDVRSNVEGALNRKLTRMDSQLTELTETTDILRNSFLFLSFGLLAAGGLLTRFGKQMQGYADSARDAFASVDWLSSIVSTTMTGTNEVIGEVREEMIRLGVDTQWTATEAGEAMQRLALAGFSVNEALGSTEAVLRLATIGLTDTATAADLAVGVFRGFHYETETAGEAAEIMTGIVSELAYAATHSATTVEELGEALKFVAAAADIVGWSLEEVTVALMVGADNMVRAGIAGRALRRSLIQLARLANITEDGMMTATKAIEAYNIQILDAQGNFKGLIDVVEELQVKLDHLTDSEKMAALGAIMGTRAVTEWAALMRETPEDLRARELALKTAYAKDVLWEMGIYNSTEQLKKWRSEMASGTSYITWFMDEMGLTYESALRFNDVITETKVSQERWNEVIEDTSRASAITAERLTTLHGTMILLQSSIDAMWASIGQELAPLLEWWNTLLKQIADNISTWPGWLKLIIGLLILFAAIILTLVGKMLTLSGSVMMLVAALWVMRKEQGKNVSITLMFTGALGMLKWALLAVAEKAWLAAGKMAVYAFRVTMALGVMYMFHHSAQVTGNNLYYLAGALVFAAQAYWVLSASTKKQIALELIYQGMMMKARIIRVVNTVVLYAHAAAIWANNVALTVFNALLMATPLGWIIGLVAALVAVFVLLWYNLDKVIEFFEKLWETITGFFRGVGDALGGFADLIGGLIGHSTIPDYFKRGTKEIGQSLDALSSHAVGTMKELKSGLSTTLAPEITGGVGAGGAKAKRVAVVYNSFGDVTIGSAIDMERFGGVVETSTRNALRKLKFELASGVEGEW